MRDNRHFYVGNNSSPIAQIMEKKKSSDLELLKALDSIQIYGGMTSYGTNSSNTGCTNTNCDCEQDACVVKCTVTNTSCATYSLNCNTEISCYVTKYILCGNTKYTDKCTQV